MFRWKRAPDKHAHPSPANGDLPDWALTYAAASIRAGFQAPDIEAALVRKGLSPKQASKVLDHCWEARVGAVETRRYRAEICQRVSRIASLAIAAGLLALVGWAGGVEAVLMFALRLLFPLACIWFAEGMGAYVGGYITRPTASAWVAIGGWLILAVITVPFLLLLF